MNIALLEGGGQNPLFSIAMFAAVFLIMYFFMLRPQKKRREELEVMREGLAKGDKVMANGIYGKVLKIDGDEVTIEIEEGRMKVHKSFIEAIPEDVPVKESK
jgi:preprotein translocase subunit YajC